MSNKAHIKALKEGKKYSLDCGVSGNVIVSFDKETNQYKFEHFVGTVVKAVLFQKRLGSFDLGMSNSKVI